LACRPDTAPADRRCACRAAIRIRLPTQIAALQPPNNPPPIPVPTPIKECFKQAGEARIAYLRAYGATAADGATSSVASETAPSGRVGPSFDCSKAASPLTLLICRDDTLSRVDLAFNQAYWALYQQLGPVGQLQLQEQDIAFIEQAQEQCGLPASGPLTKEEPQSRECVENAHEKMRTTWIGQLTGPAREEAARAPEEHVKLQQDLQQLGFLPPGPTDGVYGRDTRAAIAAWQSSHGRAATGFLGDADASAIEQDAMTTRVPRGNPSSTEALGAEDIPLKNLGGIFVVPVRINGAITLDFIVDSGASDVVLPADVAMTLARAGTISEADFTGSSEYTLAKGAKLKSARFVLRELRVGDEVITNVTASIGSVNSELLLGQSFLSRLGSWSIDNNRHVLRLTGLER
jgi:clan AA aspartic protease (TIGR02281 family)